MPHGPVVSPPPGQVRGEPGHDTDVVVERVCLLGTEVDAHMALCGVEHERRTSAALAAVTDPAVLDRLLDLPLDAAVADPIVWSETADQPVSVVERDGDGTTVTRRLQPPLTLRGVTAWAATGREASTVRRVAAFAGFVPRWVGLATSAIAEDTVLEARLLGVGLVTHGGHVLLEAEEQLGMTFDGWAWMLREKVYRRWLLTPGTGSWEGDPNANH